MRKYEVSINNKQYSVVVKKYSQQDAELEINGKPYSVKMEAPITTSVPQSAPTQSVSAPSVQPTPAPQPQAQAAPIPAATAAAPASVTAGSEVIKAPIPGSILDILVKVGDTVKEGQTVIKMEAMKMENDINTISSGVVKSIGVAIGDAVNQSQELMTIG